MGAQRVGHNWATQDTPSDGNSLAVRTPAFPSPSQRFQQAAPEILIGDPKGSKPVDTVPHDPTHHRFWRAFKTFSLLPSPSPTSLRHSVPCPGDSQCDQCTRTCVNTQTHTNTQTHRDTHTQAHGQTDTHKHTDTHTQTHRDTHTQTQTHHRLRHTDTDTHYELGSALLEIYPKERNQ